MEKENNPKQTTTVYTNFPVDFAGLTSGIMPIHVNHVREYEYAISSVMESPEYLDTDIIIMHVKFSDKKTNSRLDKPEFPQPPYTASTKLAVIIASGLSGKASTAKFEWYARMKKYYENALSGGGFGKPPKIVYFIGAGTGSKTGTPRLRWNRSCLLEILLKCITVFPVLPYTASAEKSLSVMEVVEFLELVHKQDYDGALATVYPKLNRVNYGYLEIVPEIGLYAHAMYRLYLQTVLHITCTGNYAIPVRFSPTDMRQSLGETGAKLMNHILKYMKTTSHPLAEPILDLYSAIMGKPYDGILPSNIAPYLGNILANIIMAKEANN